MTGSALRVLVAEDDPLTRTLVGSTLRGAGHDVAEVGSVREALRLLEEHEFHLVVSDLDFGPGPTGGDLLTRVEEDQPWVGKIALTSHASPELAVGPELSLPASTVYLVKSELRDVSALFEAVQRCLTGDSSRGPQSADEDGRVPVTRSQADVLRMLSTGYSTSRIAETRNTTVRATEMMVQRLYEKLGLKSDVNQDSRTGAVLMWQQGRVRVR